MILSAIVNEYIKTGDPVGSKTILSNSNINYSSATIRNDMAFLEKMGLVEQPHTSAGRIPTYLGYRLYISRLMDPYILSDSDMRDIDASITASGQTVETVLANAVEVLSDLTKLTVVYKNNLFHFSMISRVEVIPAGRRLYVLLMITSTGGIKNKICRLEFDLTNEQLGFFADFLNSNLQGINVDKITPQMLTDLSIALGSYMVSMSPLLHAVLELSEEFSHVDVNVKGQQNLLVKNEIDTTEVIRFLNEKSEIEKLLSDVFDDIEIIFGRERDVFTISNSSIIVSPYKRNNEIIGSMGVIGPLRLDYAKILPYVRYFSQSLNRYLNLLIDDDNER